MLPMAIYGALALGVASLPLVISIALSSKAPLRGQARWHLGILVAGVILPFVLPVVAGGYEYVLVPVASLVVTIVHAIRLKGQRVNSAVLGLVMTVAIVPVTGFAVLAGHWPD